MSERRKHVALVERRDARTAWLLMTPALATLEVVTLFPIAWTFWESLHVHDLRMPWLGRPFVGLLNYADAFADARFRTAALHSGLFAVGSVTLEIVCGLALALLLDLPSRARGALRVAALLPWAVPTVVGALVWRFIFEGQTGLANAALIDLGVLDAPRSWLTD